MPRAVRGLDGGMQYRNGNGWLVPAVVSTVVLLLQALWAVVWSTVTNEQTKLEHEIELIQKEFVRVSLFNEYRETIGVEFKRIDEKTEINRKDNLLVRSTFLTKDEYYAKRQPLEEDIKRMDDRITEIRKDFGSTYTLNDKLKELQDQLRQIQDRIYNAKLSPVAPIPSNGLR